MKKILKSTVMLSVAALGLLGSCTSNFDEINTNSSTYTQASFDPNFLLTTSQLTYAGSTDFAYETWRGNLIYASTFMQGFATVVGYWAGDKYTLNEGYTAAYWEKAYGDQVKPVVDMREFTKDKPQYKNLYQISRIMRALIMERVTDLYGDVPYSEAGLGYYTGVIRPKYDSQQAIYADILQELTEATAALDPAADKITGDLYYQGDLAKWQRFGNSLILRAAMRLVKVDPATAQKYATQVQGKTMTSNADNAFAIHDAAGGRDTKNRNSQILTGEGGQENYYTKWSDTFINLLKTNNDPRLGKVAVTQLYLTEGGKTQNTAYVTDPAKQKGQPNGKDLTQRDSLGISLDPSFTTFPDYSSPNPGMIRLAGPTFVLTYGESELLLADAAQRFGIGSAAEHYTNGVTAAGTYLGQYAADLAVTPAAMAAYLAAHPYAAATGLEQINTQYWILSNTMLDFYESWSNWRRTGFPVLVPVNYPSNATKGTIPRRFPYPLSEASSNPDNYKAAKAAVTGGDFLTSRVYWDK